MTMKNGGDNDGFDYLESPPIKQSTPQDGLYSLQTELAKYLKDIRRESLKNNPDILATTLVAGGKIIQNEDISTRIHFEVNGKQVRVYKVIFWTDASVTARMSVTGMSVDNDGFLMNGNLQTLEVPVDELYVITHGVGGTTGVNIPNGAEGTSANLFIYGFTIQDYDERN